MKYRHHVKKEDHRRYKRLRNRVNIVARNQIAARYGRRLRSARTPTQLWKCVDDMSITTEFSEPSELPASCDAINQHFVGAEDPVELSDTRATARVSTNELFYSSQVTPEEVIEAVTSAKSNAVGPDSFPLSCIKKCLPNILPILLMISDFAFQSGFFPTTWMSAIVRPIPKSSPPLKIDHLHPISILGALSKILETVALNQIPEVPEPQEFSGPVSIRLQKIPRHADCPHLHGKRHPARR